MTKFVKVKIGTEDLVLPDNYTTHYLIGNPPTAEMCEGLYATFLELNLGRGAHVSNEEAEAKMVEEIRKGNMKQVAEHVYCGGIANEGSDLHTGLISVENFTLDIDYTDYYAEHPEEKKDQAD